VRRLSLVLALYFLASCASVSKERSLYVDLGGEAGVKRLVDRLLVKYREDDRINDLFENANFEYFAERLNEYICMKTGGGCEYMGLDMVEAHSGMAIRTREFNYFVEDSQAAMRELGISEGVQNRLLEILARDQPDVIRQ
jgi:hemoglobin